MSIAENKQDCVPGLVPADGTMLPIRESGDFGRSPFLGSSQGKPVARISYVACRPRSTIEVEKLIRSEIAFMPLTAFAGSVSSNAWLVEDQMRLEQLEPTRFLLSMTVSWPSLAPSG
jgi:hypothetical protein